MIFSNDFLHFDFSSFQAIDGRLPGANEYLLLSGSSRDGTVDLEIQTPRPTPEPGYFLYLFLKN